MQITLSERKFSERIRQLENLPAEVTTEEITHRLDKYAAELFRHLRGYGLNSIGLLGIAGSLGTFQVTLDRCWDDESRNKRIEGLAMLDPLSVTLEQSDLAAFFTGIVLVAMHDGFNNYASDLQRVTVGELNRKLIEIANTLFSSAPPPPPKTAVEALMREQDYEMFLARAGKKDPLAKFQAVDEYHQAEIAAVKAAEEQRAQDFYGRSGE